MARCLGANSNPTIGTRSAARGGCWAENAEGGHAQRRCDVHQSCIARDEQVTAAEHRHCFAKVPFASAFKPRNLARMPSRLLRARQFVRYPKADHMQVLEATHSSQKFAKIL